MIDRNLDALASPVAVATDEVARSKPRPSEEDEFIATPCFMPPIKARQHEAKCWKSPDCFGSPCMFDGDCRECRKCQFGFTCRDMSAELRITIQTERAKWLVETLGIVVSPEPAALAPAPKPWWVGIVRTHYYLKKHVSQRKKAKASDAEYQHAKRAEPSPIALIEAEYRKRLKRLQLTVRVPDGDKRLEQLRGREYEIALAWKARAVARLRHGPNASDEQVAKVLAELSGSPTSRHRARGYRLLVGELEQVSWVWERFATAPGSLPDYLRAAATPPRKKAPRRASARKPAASRRRSVDKTLV